MRVQTNHITKREFHEMKKKMLLVLAAAVMVIGSVCTPIVAHADGGPLPDCKPGTTCKP
jgi:hypothetical protein